MHFLTIAVLLASTSASSIGTFEERRNALKDLKAPLKIKNQAIFLGGSNFYNVLSGVCNSGKTFNSAECNSELKKIRAGMTAARRSVAPNLETYFGDQGAALNDVHTSLFREDSVDRNLLKWAHEALNYDKKEWEAAEKAVALINYNDLGPAYMNSRISNLKAAYEAENLRIPSNNEGASLRDVAINNIDKLYKFCSNFKSWVIATKLFGNPSEVNTPNPDEFIGAQDFETLLRTLNVPEGRFRVSPIEPTLNLKFIMSTDNSMSLESALATLDRLFTAYYNKLGKDFNKDGNMNLRRKVMNALFGTPTNRDFDELSLEKIEMRVKALERIVEGIIRSYQDGKTDINETLATKAIQAWIMAKQMVDVDGWKDENVKFGLLPLPEGVTLDLSGNIPPPPPPAPKVEESKPAPAEASKSSSIFSSVKKAIFGA